MNKWLKIVCLVLVFAFILPALVACDKDKDGEKNNGDDNGEGVVVTPPESVGSDKDYGGDTFTMYSVEDMFAKQYFFADKTTGEGMNDSLYQRQQNVEKTVNVNLEWKAAAGSGETPAFIAYATEVQNAIKAGDAKYQLVLSHAYYALPDLITSGSFKDFKQLSSITPSADYWNEDIMKQVSYKDSYYLGYSDFNLAQTYVIAFNKNILNNIINNFDNNTNALYDYVTNGEWTLDTMSEVAALGFQDNGSDETNVYGLTGELWVPFVGFLQSSGEALVTKNEQTGKYAITWRDNKTVKNKINDVVNTIRDINGMQETYFWKHETFEPSRKTVLLKDNRAFMQLMGTSELIKLKDTQVKFGVLPYPMYDNAQSNSVGYRSLNWAGYLCVPSNNIDNENMVSDVIECLSAYSESVTTYYYEKLLGLKVSEAPKDAEMLEIIWDSLCSDFGIAYEMIDDKGNMDAIVYMIPRCVMDNSQFNSWDSRYGGAANNAINNKLNK